tara:strand:- start:578 stop:5275 length:4698 start_codon:yes stop_codon:yes gene_type:complete
MSILKLQNSDPFFSFMEENGFIVSPEIEEETEEERQQRLEEERQERIRLEEERKQIQEEELKKAEEEKIKLKELNRKKTNSFTSFVKENNLAVTEVQKDFKFPKPVPTEKGSAVLLKRKLAYGAAQEPTIAGNVYRLGKARLESWMSNKTYKQAAREIEAERQKAIAIKFPELINQEEDAAILMGRMGVAIADPVTLFIPWFKIAKAGKLATTVTGAGVSGVDIALRDEALYGGTNPTSVGIAMALGGTSSYISSLISPITRKTADEFVEVTGTTGKTNRKKVNFNKEKTNFNPTSEQIDMFEELGQEGAIQNAKQIANILDHSDNAGLIHNQIAIIRAEKQLLSDDIKKLNNEIKSLISKDKSTEVRDKAKIRINEQITAKNKEINKLTLEIEQIYVDRLPREFADIGYTNFINAYKKGVLTKDFASALMQETVRPFVGMIGGFAVGVTTADEDDTMNYVYTMMGMGAFLGGLQKKIQVSDFKIKKTDPVLAEYINTGEDIYRKTVWAGLKRLTAGTHSAKLQSGVEAVRDFGARMFKVQGAGIKTGVPIKESVEESKQISLNYWTSIALPEIIGDYSMDTVMAAGRLVNQRGMRTNAKHSFLKEGDLQNFEARELASKIINITDEFKKYTKSVGINLKEEDFYGLTQLVKNPNTIRAFRDDLKEAFKIQFVNDHKTGKLKFTDGKWVHQRDIGKENIPRDRLYSKKQIEDALKDGKWLNEWAEKQARNYVRGASQERKTSLWALDETATVNDHLRKGSLFKSRGGEEENLIITAARHFENERVLYDQEARAFMASKDFFEDDPINTLLNLFEQTIPVAEFSRVFGSKGEGIRQVFQNINSQIRRGSDNISLENLAKKQIKDVKDSVEAYFGMYGKIDDFGEGELAKTLVASLQAVLSTTKLTKVALPSLGDLIQTYKNSGFKAAGLSAIRRFNREENYIPSESLGFRAKRPQQIKEKERYGDVLWNNRRYNGLLEREMRAWMIESSQSGGLGPTIQRGLSSYQRKFFEIVQLGRITRFAREYAFDAGAIRAWQIGKEIGDSTNKVSRKIQKELDTLGLSVDNARYLSKFKNMNDIEGDKLGERFINRAGMKSADRDALIPTVGNRRLFSQSRNPTVRFLGSFLSWAQAKSSQLNSLVSRVENGDAVLALRMASAIPVFGAVRYAQLELNPSSSFKKDSIVAESKYIKNELKQLGDALIFSAETMPWYLDKVVNEVRYDYGSTPVSGLAPVIELMDQFASSAMNVGFSRDSKEQVKALWGTKGILGTTIPFYKDFEKWVDLEKRMLGEYVYRGEELEEQEEERVDDKTRFFKGGEVSEENPVPNAAPEPSERVNPYTGQPYEAEMERLGFKDGLLVSIGVAPVSEKQIDKLKKGLKKRKAMREGSLIKKAIKDYFRVEELKQEIREREGFKEEAYKPDPTEEHYTIGYGFYDPNIKENDRMTREEAEERLDKEVNKRIEKIYKDIPGIINFSPSAQKALFSETYRGSLTTEGSPKTIALINEGRYMDAGKEFLNNDEYRNAEALGIPGIRPRMEAVRDELFKMDAGFQKQQSDFYQSVVPYGQQ